MMTLTPILRSAALFLLLPLAIACGPSGNGNGGNGDDDDDSPPTVMSVSPQDAESDAPLNGSITATFDRAIDPVSVTADSFVVVDADTDLPVAGALLVSGEVVTFWPAAYLASNASFTTTVTQDVRSLAGVYLEADYDWSFGTGNFIAPGLGVNLATAGGYAVLAKSGISTVPASDITGDIAVSPAAATYITGFSLSNDATEEFATSTQVTGRVYAADYSGPTPSNLTTAIGDMQIAFTDAASRAPDVTELGAGNIGGMTLDAGVYKWSSGVLIPTDITLAGSATDVWIFQIAQDLTVSSAVNVALSGGALAKNVFWQVSGSVELGTTSHFEGIVLSQTAITLATGASINGRLLAQTAVDVDTATIVEPAN